MPGIPNLLRLAGVLLTLAAGLNFIMEDILQNDPLGRLGLFTGFTTLLCAAGNFIATSWNDRLGGRLFLIISTAMSPAILGQLGGILLTRAYGDFTLASLTIATLALISLTSWIGFASMIRRQAHLLTSLYLLVSSTLLLPMRDPVSIGLLTLANGSAASLALIYLRRHERLTASTEGLFSQLMFLPPILILVGRSIVHHEVGPFLGSVASALAPALIFFHLAPAIRNHAARTTWTILSGLALFLTALIALDSLLDPPQAQFAVQCLIPATMLLSLAAGIHAPKTRQNFLCTLWTLALFIISFDLFNYPSAQHTFIYLLTALAAILTALRLRSAYALLLGVLFFIAILARIISDSLSFMPGLSWGYLGLLGIAAIISASYIEKHDSTRKIKDFLHSIAQW